MDIECTSNTCKNGGSCQSIEGNYSCKCLEGFAGAHCEQNINDCLPNPCKNGGSCYDGINDYNCNCTSQFMGKNCDKPYNPCEIKGGQCKNGGQCKTRIVTSGLTQLEDGMPKDFYCECPLGFSGPRCETNDNDCLGVNCPPNQICYDKVGTYECGCPQGKTGETCQENVNECAQEPCKNGGTCSPTANGYRLVSIRICFIQLKMNSSFI